MLGNRTDKAAVISAVLKEFQKLYHQGITFNRKEKGRGGGRVGLQTPTVSVTSDFKTPLWSKNEFKLQSKTCLYCLQS